MEIVHYGVKTEPINKNIKIYPYYVRIDDQERKKKCIMCFMNGESSSRLYSDRL